MISRDLSVVLQELSAREPILHRRELGTTRDALEAMIADDFLDIGASGRVYDRAYAIETSLDRYARGPEPHDWLCSDFAVRQVASDLFQITYVLSEPDRTTRRSTFWRDDNGTWKIVFHQGTVIT